MKKDHELLAKELNYDDAEASRAFEWLRAQALDEDVLHRTRQRYAAIMLAEVAKLKERDGYVQGDAWISVEDREPPKDGTASLAFFPGRGGYIARQDMQPIYWTGEAWQVSISGHNVYERFTHWTPLPKAPILISHGGASGG